MLDSNTWNYLVSSVGHYTAADVEAPVLDLDYHYSHAHSDTVIVSLRVPFIGQIELFTFYLATFLIGNYTTELNINTWNYLTVCKRMINIRWEYLSDDKINNVK